MPLPINEIFTTVQAEGNHRTPAVFVRVYGCSLSCRFNGKTCDTPYAVCSDDPNDKVMMNVQDVADKIRIYGLSHVVFTGGEPTLYQKEIHKIIKELPGTYFVEVETNGTQPIKPWFAQVVDQFNISVKLKCSNQPKAFEKVRINKKAIVSFPASKSIFKFVVDKKADFKEIDEITSYNAAIPVYLMPQGDNRKTLLKNIKKVMEWCIAYDYGFTNRDHILAFDKKRGV